MAQMFLKLDGIEGESLDAFHANEIEIFEWTWELDNKASFEMKQAEASTKVDIQNIVITKICDKASVTLVKYCALGKHVPAGTITCRKNDGELKVIYLLIELKNIMIHSVNWTGKGAHHELFENVTLSFAEFKLSYSLQQNSGDLAMGTTDFGFNVQTHTPT